ncbi:MAG: ImmA/IrrE family metallo-endopeptidase [bacterium]
MNYQKIKIPFLDNQKIKQKADDFRERFWGKAIPVDIEKIIEFRQKITIIPLPNLQEVCNTDAFISSDWLKVFIDQAEYMDERKIKRLRFSLAHEIGHMVLHKDIYESFDIKNFNDFYRFIDEIPNEQYGYLETQANKLANQLLIPREFLSNEYNKIFKKYSRLLSIQSSNTKLLNSYIANPLSKIFLVSADAIEIALSDINITEKDK